MSDFTNPFVQMTPDRKMTLSELVRAVRMNLAAEMDAASLYEAHADATDNPLAKKVFLDIANEERVHAGEFLELLRILLPDEDAWLQHGIDEVREMAEEIEKGNLDIATPEQKAEEERPDEPDEDIPTIGSMR